MDEARRQAMPNERQYEYFLGQISQAIDLTLKNVPGTSLMPDHTTKDQFCRHSLPHLRTAQQLTLANPPVSSYFNQAAQITEIAICMNQQMQIRHYQHNQATLLSSLSDADLNQLRHERECRINLLGNQVRIVIAIYDSRTAQLRRETGMQEIRLQAEVQGRS